MAFKSDIEIAQENELAKITEIAKKIGIGEDHLELYGNYKAKIKDNKDGKLILVTAITPTPAGEGKTTTTVGLADGMSLIGEKVMVALREPSLGPVFGMKGGAAGGGYAQIVPMEDINLHFTGDMHAIGAANNLLAAMVDNHIHQGNLLGIDPRRIPWKRCVDMNDRQLRNVVDGLGGKAHGVPREDGFEITVASEIMAILCLAKDIEDLKGRISDIIIGYTYDNRPIKAEEINAQGAVAALLKDAVKPNLVQTLEKTPAFVHGGPFANIAHGCNSVIATKTALKLADYVITEAGFGADMGAERLFNVKCRISGLKPDAAVLVVTVRALKSHSGLYKIVPGKPLPDGMLQESPSDVEAGAANLKKHIEIVRNFGVQPVVAINAFPTDFDSEHEAIRRIAEEAGARVAIHRGVAEGGKGTVDLANVVAEACDDVSELKFTYDLEDSLETKLEKVATKVYGADGISIAPAAAKQLKRFADLGYGNLPVVIAKTHLSISSDASLKGAPTGWTLPVREVRLAAGAGYVYAICGTMRTMPGLSKSPAAERIGFDENGTMVGLS